MLEEDVKDVKPQPPPVVYDFRKIRYKTSARNAVNNFWVSLKSALRRPYLLMDVYRTNFKTF
jgi:hypothetical protein